MTLPEQGLMRRRLQVFGGDRAHAPLDRLKKEDRRVTVFDAQHWSQTIIAAP